MHKLFYLLLATVWMSGTSLWAQKNTHPSIKGEGELVREEFNLSAFQGIELSICGDVELTPGTMQKVVVEGQKNILDNIRREVNQGIWDIAFKQEVSDAKDVKVYITVPVITRVGISGCGDVRSTGPFTGMDKLELNLSGSGDLHMQATTGATFMRLSGSGDIEMSGTTKSLEIKMVGSGDVSAKDLESKDCRVDISGSGDAVVNASQTLTVMISGSGDVRYKGAASVTAKVSGSGDVGKL